MAPLRHTHTHHFYVHMWFKYVWVLFFGGGGGEICSSLSTLTGDAWDVCTRVWPSRHHHQPPPTSPLFTGTKQQPVLHILHHCSAPAADAQLRFSRGALTSLPPPSQSSPLFILSNTRCLTRGGHVGCFAGSCHVSSVVHNSCNDEQRSGTATSFFLTV